MNGTDRAAQAPHLVRTICKYGVVLAAVFSGAIGWCMTGLVLQGSVDDFQMLNNMTPNNSSTFDKIFIMVLFSGLAMFGTSFLGCIGVLRGNKGLMFAFSVCAFCMALILTSAATAASMILTGAIPPIIMQTNRICRNYEDIYYSMACVQGESERRRLDEAEPTSWSYARMIQAAQVAMTFQEEGRRLEAGVSEVQFLERIAANQNEDKCAILVDICKLPQGVGDMSSACTCNGLGVVDMKRNSQSDMNWACPQRVEQEQAPPECGSFCADWDGTGDLAKSWCFINSLNTCVTHMPNANETFGAMEPSTEACQAMTLIQYPWSGIVSRGIFVAKVGMGSTTAMAMLMFFSTFSAWFLIWCTPGNKYWFSEAMALQRFTAEDSQSDVEMLAAERTSSRASRVSSRASDYSDGGRDDRDSRSGGSSPRRNYVTSEQYTRE